MVGVPRRAFTSFTRAAAAAGLGYSAASVTYLLVLLAAGSRLRARDDGPEHRPKTVVLVPAHNEAGTIAPCLRALASQDVPHDSLDVIVIADNCTDETADVARAEDVRVWVRSAPDARGKGQALAWALDRLEHELPRTEVVGIVDADCISSPGLCRAWANGLSPGVVAVQADYTISNWAESSAAARRWAGFALMHRIRAGGKERLGLSVGLFGTGMAFSMAHLREVPWTSFSITEDAEHHVRIVESGSRVVYASEASVASPAPTSEREAQIQQLRWETGNAALARRVVPHLLITGAARRDVQRLHLAFERIVPPQSMLAAGSLTATAVATIGRHHRLSGVGFAVMTGQVAYVLLGLAAAGAPGPVWTSLVGAPALAVHKVGQVARIASGRGAKTWQRTER